MRFFPPTQTSFFDTLTEIPTDGTYAVTFTSQPAMETILAGFRHYNEADDVQHWQVPEEEYIQMHYTQSLEQARRNAQLSQEQLDEFLQRKSRQSIKTWNTLTIRARYWKEAAERLAAADGITEQARQGAHESYVKLVKEAIKHGKPVPEPVIAQYPEFTVAANARARYQKGWKTSFANQSIAVDNTMQTDRGYKVKRQDGKTITPEQIAEIDQAVAEVESVIGGLRDLFLLTDITIAHASGKHPFLSGAGGMYHYDERTVTMGTLGVNATAHELGHWFDIEAGKFIGVERTMRIGERTEKMPSLAEVGQGGDLIRTAGRLMTDTTSAEHIVKGHKMKVVSYTPDEQGRIKLKLGHYWRSSREIWARLVEQYVATKLGPEPHLSVDADYESLPAYWSRDKFEQLMPLVESEIDLRLWILRGNATTYANKVRFSIIQSGGADHGRYYIAEKGFGAKRPSILVMDTGTWSYQNNEYHLVRSEYDHDNGWKYTPVDDKFYRSLDEAKKAAEAYLAGIPLELPQLAGANG
jgi:hypothetical protein